MVARDEKQTPDAPRRPDRREVLVGAAAASVLASGIAAAVTRGADAGRGVASAPGTTGSTSLLGKVPDTSATSTTSGAVPVPSGGRVPSGPGRARMSEEARAQHVANRLTYGPTPALLAEIRAVGVDAWIDQQLNPASIDDGAADAIVARLPLVALEAADIPVASRHDAIESLRLAAVLRAVSSRRQLFELVVDMWSNHLHVWADIDERGWAEKVEEDRTVHRAHALGRFADLLAASATSGAMLRFLNSVDNVKLGPNENYARELHELHTVGVEGGFTEADVLAAARVLTGWGVNDRFQFEFHPGHHDPSPQEVFGWSTGGHDGPDGVVDGLALIDHLAHHPATARRIATVLARRFVADEPPVRVIDVAARAYLDNDTAIAPVLAAIFATDEFWDSAGTKLRRPFELVAAALRATGATIEPAVGEGSAGRELDLLLERLGHRLYGWSQPDGYPDVASAWLGAGGVLARWNGITQIAANRLVGIRIDPAALTGPLPANAGALSDAVVARLQLPALPERRDAMLSGLGVDAFAPADAGHIPALVAFAFSSREAQWR